MNAATARKVQAWRKRQNERCAQWIQGQQCHHFKMPGQRYCGLHGKGEK